MGKATLRGRKRQDPDRGVGPAVVLATEGATNVWLSYHGNLIKEVALHLRPATADENMAAKFVLDHGTRKCLGWYT
eukprot:5263906-Prorocentrum_lima.AAC.1